MIEIDMRKFVIAVIVILIVWGSLLFVIVRYGESVTADPCAVCAKRMGKNVVCNQVETEGFKIPATRVYYPNGTIYDEKIEYAEESPLTFSQDFSKFNITVEN